MTFTGLNTGGLLRLFMIYKPFNITMTNTDFLDAIWQPGSYGILTGYSDNIAECPYSYSTDLFENNTQINTKMAQTNIPF